MVIVGGVGVGEAVAVAVALAASIAKVVTAAEVVVDVAFAAAAVGNCSCCTRKPHTSILFSAAYLNCMSIIPILLPQGLEAL